MSMLFAVAALSLLAEPAPAQAQFDVAFDELAAAENSAAIEKIEANTQIDPSDPARLINLGIAYAREGRVLEARGLFEAVAKSDIRVSLETATGEWVDSHRLAHKALAMLDARQFDVRPADDRTRMAAR